MKKDQNIDRKKQQQSLKGELIHCINALAGMVNRENFKLAVMKFENDKW